MLQTCQKEVDVEPRCKDAEQIIISNMRAMQKESNFSVTRAAAKRAAATTGSSQKEAPVMTKAQLAAVERADK